MRQRPRVGRRAQAGLNPTPWLHGPHGRSGWPPSPRVRCTPAPKKPSSHSLGESRPFPPPHTGPSDGRVYTVLPIPSSPSNDQWVSPWRAVRPPNKRQREHSVEGCRRGATAGGRQAPLVSRAFQPGSQPECCLLHPSFSQPVPCRPGAQLCWGICRRGKVKGRGQSLSHVQGPGSPLSHLEAVELRWSISEPRRWAQLPSAEAPWLWSRCISRPSSGQAEWSLKPSCPVQGDRAQPWSRAGEAPRLPHAPSFFLL